MSAPSTAYFPINAKFRGSNNVEMTINPAKANAVIATLKARFYLDDVIAFQANVNGVLYHGFWGTVLPSGFNYDHHKTSRLLEINGPKPGQILRTFNDAGLNTLGDAASPSVVSNTVGSLAFSANFLSSFYLNSSNTTIDHKIDAGSWNVGDFGGLSEKLSASQTKTLSSLTLVQKGQTIYIKATILNDEGNFTSTIISTIVQAKSMVARFSSSWPSQAIGSTTIWAKTNFNYDTFYTDTNCTASVADGYYVFGGYWYQVTSGAIVQQGSDTAGSYPTGDPGNPSVESWNSYGYSTVSRADALANATTTLNQTHYKNSSNNLWYTSYNSSTLVFSSLVTDGFYSDYPGTGFTKAYVSGVLKSPSYMP